MDKFKLGEFITANRGKSYQYRQFRPSLINRKWHIEPQELLNEHDKAIRLLGKLDAYSEIIDDVDFFIGMHIAKEAVESSKIEGTKTELDEAFLDKKQVGLNKRDDWQEVQNYIVALNYAIESNIPISIRLLNEVHEKLLSTVRGDNKNPGQIRRSQNWIGGTSINNASFVPPANNDLPNLLSDLEKFINNNGSLPVLLKIALTHYQFETIHPYLDGNGRIGRLLIVLQLIREGFLSKPTLYLSDFFSKNRMSYYDHLMFVRNSNNLNKWFKFFLDGINTTAQSGIDKFSKILELKKNIDKKISNLNNRSKNAHILVNYMYKKPIITINETANLLKISHQSASALVKAFIHLGILEDFLKVKRNRIFVFKEYIDLFKK